MSRRRLAAATAAAAAAALLLAGCTLGPSPRPTGVALTVTRDFGATDLSEQTAPTLGAKDTVVGLLERNARVELTSAGTGVAGIGGLAGDWFYYVNGVGESSGAASTTTLHRGDHVWWDRHDARLTASIPAVVGAFPEPFLDGTGGKRLPVRVECIDPASPACAGVSHALTGLGIPAARGGLGLTEDAETLRVLVGTWPRMRTDPTARRLETGPGASGVYARITADGSRIAVLDARGAVVQTLGAGSGLVAASRFGPEPPVWIVTGTDDAGVLAAATAFEPGALHDRFALAVSGGIGVPLPAGG